jgi:2-polyprenyl-6-methoxyphenol hydroxylase-like FAD-dependent oxidoreductase
MKIIIVGGGVGGVASYLALQKYLYSVSGLSIKIYESHSDPSATTSFIGGGLGLAPNGLRAISSFCPVAAERIQATGFPNHAMTFRNSKGVLLGKLAVGKGGRYGCPQMMLSRAAVHEALLAEVPEGAIEWGKRVCAVIETVEGVEVGFEDGAVEKADLVIGADGVRSMVREAVVGCNYPARYEQVL